LFVRYLAIFRPAAAAAGCAAPPRSRDLDNNRSKSVMREFPSGIALGGHLSRRSATTLTRAVADQLKLFCQWL